MIARGKGSRHITNNIIIISVYKLIELIILYQKGAVHRAASTFRFALRCVFVR